jgi:hypothetical protein
MPSTSRWTMSSSEVRICRLTLGRSFDRGGIDSDRRPKSLGIRRGRGAYTLSLTGPIDGDRPLAMPHLGLSGLRIGFGPSLRIPDEGFKPGTLEVPSTIDDSLRISPKPGKAGTGPVQRCNQCEGRPGVELECGDADENWWPAMGPSHARCRRQPRLIIKLPATSS